MGKKVALNVLFNVGIIISLFVGYEGIMAKHYSYLLAAVFMLAIFVVLKVRLIKEVREMNRKK